MKTHLGGEMLGLFALLAMLAGSLPAAEPDLVFADFEGNDYGAWRASGEAFGSGPAEGTLPRQMRVEGFQGRRLVNSFHGGDRPTGELVSPEFKVERRQITFLIGGGGWAGKTCINLLVDGQIVRTATGPNTKPGGSERLEPAGWDVSPWLGKQARLAIVDQSTGGWGHINVDQIVFTDTPLRTFVRDASRELTAERHYLLLPVANGGAKRKLVVSVDGKPEPAIDIELADGKPDWWAPLDISAWRGRRLKLSVDKQFADSQALEQIRQSDAPEGAADLYREPLRPQLHFSPRFGWNNDPNGLVYFAGKYHLFFQHNPYGTQWGNMHWGHATSPDLVRWTELAEALDPDAMGPMFSGSAVVDWKNTSGLGKDGQPPIVLIYTAAGKPTVQAIAFSSDAGSTFAKYGKNPVLGQITPGNRDPKVFWHEPSRRWVMVLYVGHPGPVDAAGKPTVKHSIHFLTSRNLKHWNNASQIDGFYECPDFFELPVEGDSSKRKWLLTGANSDYQLGSFDGKTFQPDNPIVRSTQGKAFYAAQTFSDIPASDGRRIQIGWLRAPSPGMAFNQAMSLPLELGLRSTSDGLRLVRRPVKELTGLRTTSRSFGPLTLTGNGNVLVKFGQPQAELRAEFEPGEKSEIIFDVCGFPIRYDAATQQLTAGGQSIAAPLVEKRQRLIVYVDRTVIEIFASDGLVYLPLPVITKPDNLAVEITAAGGSVNLQSLELYDLRSIWNQPGK
jgi:sucrose-6-phosphate hydrolase SacC (GH32 family)